MIAANTDKPTISVTASEAFETRNFSLTRPSIVKDILTEDDFCEGWCDKQQPNMLKRWQKRYFVLDKKLIKYYKKKEDYIERRQPKGVLNLKQIWIKPVFNPLGFKIDL